MAPKIEVTRRKFVKDAGGLLIGFSLVDSAILPRMFAASPRGCPRSPSPSRLDSWLRIDKEGLVHVFTGKAEIGMGVRTALAQIVAEELDVPRESCRHGDGRHVHHRRSGRRRRQHLDHAGRETPAQRFCQRALSAAANGRAALRCSCRSDLEVKDGVVQREGRRIEKRLLRGARRRRRLE